MKSHGTASRSLYGEQGSVVDAVIADLGSAPVTPMMRALLEIADKVRQDGRLVTAEDIQRARAVGADDQAIHDTVLITGMFSMFNRYVDGLATFTPTDQAGYDEIGERIAEHGYGSRPYPDGQF